MTKHLSDLLQAPEPAFRLQLQQLERASGHQNLDIKVSVAVRQAAQAKLHQLGLDHADTTAEELYQTLGSRLTTDDQRLARALQTRAATYVSAEADVTAGLLHALHSEVKTSPVFALKAAVVKKQLKQLTPKRLQKLLGYRSAEAMLRAEAPANLVAAALLVESTAWRRSWQEAYKQLRPSDFESSTIKITSLQTGRWSKVRDQLVTTAGHTVLAMPELGAIVLLPLPSQRPAGMVVATLAITLHELNSISAASNYLRASQVQADFAKRVQEVARGGIQLNAPQLGTVLPWHFVQRYFADTKAAISEDIFGPYIEAADFAWHNVEAIMTKICPSLEFWEGAHCVSFLQSSKAVSCNVLDVAINCCNQLSFAARQLSHAQQALWSELASGYLDHSSLEAAVARVLRPQLASEMAVA